MGCLYYIIIPTRTRRGWMSPDQCVPGGRTPNLSQLQRWGCNAHVVIPKADLRKDWEDKAVKGYFIRYSKTKAGNRVTLWLPPCMPCLVRQFRDLQKYFRELDESTVKVS